MYDPYAAPTLLLLMAVTGMFYAVHRRQRQTVTLLMFLAWVGFSLRMSFVELGTFVHPAGRAAVAVQAFSDAVLLSAILVLCGALTTERFGRREWMRYAVAALLPLNGLIFCAAGASHARPALTVLTWLFYGGLLWVFFRWNLASTGLLRATGFACSAVLVLWGGLFLLRADYDGLETVFAAVTLFYAAIAYARLSGRWSVDSFLVVSGLSGWGFVFVVAELLPMTPAVASLLDRASDLLKIVTAVGLVISLVEEETRNSTDARGRERRLREELESYTAIDLAAMPLMPQDILFEEVCSAAAHASPFRECALLLRTVSGSRLVCSSETPRDTVALLEAAAKRLDAGEKLQEPVLGALRPCLITPPGEAVEYLGYLLPLLSQGGVPQGCMWLGTPRLPVGALGQELLLPLEGLAGRLGVALENRELTQRLIRADRLAGLGKLAGGIAHELNNPLTIVRGYAELIEDGTGDPEVRKQARHILHESNRMERIVADMSQFWRTAGPDYAPVDCGELLGTIEKMHRPDIQKRGCGLTVNVPAGLPPVMGSRDSLTQVVVQLLQNAIQAIEVSAGKRRPGFPAGAPEKQIRMDATHVQDRVQITVSDNGPGFADPERAFDPFYTTREPGEGTGLGLSVCYGLIRQHRGEVWAINLQPHGAAVIIDLPAVPMMGPEQAAEQMIAAE